MNNVPFLLKTERERMFVDENPLLLLGVCGRAIAAVVAPATMAPSEPPVRIRRWWEELCGLPFIKIPSLCVCAQQAAAEGQGFCELETFGICGWLSCRGDCLSPSVPGLPQLGAVQLTEQMLPKPGWDTTWCPEGWLCCKSLHLCSGKQAISKHLCSSLHGLRLRAGKSVPRFSMSRPTGGCRPHCPPRTAPGHPCPSPRWWWWQAESNPSPRADAKCCLCVADAKNSSAGVECSLSPCVSCSIRNTAVIYCIFFSC